MVKVNLNWLGQISNDLILDSDFHNIIEDPDIPETLLKDNCIVSILSFSIPVEMLGWRGGSYLEQGVVFEEIQHHFAGLFCSLFQSRGDLDTDGGLCG